MKRCPPIPDVADAPDELLQGHLWLLEKVDGTPLRFQMRESGLVRFGDRDAVYDDPDDTPLAYRHAVRHVRENLDRDALRSAVDDVEDVVFFGVATHRRAIEYDWDRLPSFLGVDVWSESGEVFRPPDAVEAIFDRLGLRPVNAFERERHARDFDLDAYTIPESAWYDGPAAGVIVRNKRGGRGKLVRLEGREGCEEPSDDGVSPEELAERYATQQRFEKIVVELAESGRPATVETLHERVVEDIAREAHTQLEKSNEGVDATTFRSEIAALTRAFFDDHDAW